MCVCLQSKFISKRVASIMNQERKFPPILQTRFESTQDKWSQNAMKFRDNLRFGFRFDNLAVFRKVEAASTGETVHQWVSTEPQKKIMPRRDNDLQLLKGGAVWEDIRKDEIQQRPQLRQVILQGQEETKNGPTTNVQQDPSWARTQVHALGECAPLCFKTRELMIPPSKNQGTRERGDHIRDLTEKAWAHLKWSASQQESIFRLQGFHGAKELAVEILQPVRLINNQVLPPDREEKEEKFHTHPQKSTGGNQV